jgi:DNA-binding NarL/FixJ family response regulator
LNKIILADNQIVFRAGAAHALTAEAVNRIPENRLIAQCESAAQLLQAVEAFPGSIVLFASAMLSGAAALDDVTGRVAAAGSRTILIMESGETTPQEMLLKVDGAIARNISAAELVACVRNVAQGQRSIVRTSGEAGQLMDTVGARVRDRLTPKEMQIVALVVQGCKNREIAEKLDTKEQVIKNYLRSVYDKTGVSDRLELALFTVHHRILAEAAAKAGHLIQQKQSG